MTETSATQRGREQADAIRPFHANVSDADLAEIRKRIDATKWPERETVTDATQGVQLATMQAVARYWATDYDWRKVEARLNALPNFITEIDGLDIHFIHVRSKHENALPLIVTHGWPGSITEQLKIIDPLTNPTAHGGNASDAFHIVVPSMPGYGFSGKPTTTGWDPAHIARAWTVLMKRLGYNKFVAQGVTRFHRMCITKSEGEGAERLSRRLGRAQGSSSRARSLARPTLPRRSKTPSVTCRTSIGSRKPRLPTRSCSIR
jgi:hypothetical protein